MEDIYMIDKNLMKRIIGTLKTLNVQGWDSMDALVGVVMLLEQGMNPPKPKAETEVKEVKE